MKRQKKVDLVLKTHFMGELGPLCRKHVWLYTKNPSKVTCLACLKVLEERNARV